MRILLVALITSLLGGCSLNFLNGPKNTGSFIEDAPAIYSQQIANDVRDQLVYHHAPGNTQFSIRQRSNDAFGQTLITALRNRGFAVSELAKGEKPGEPSGPSDGSVPIYYLVDFISEASLYRVVITAGNKSYSRVYQADNNRLYPASAWTVKE